MFLLRDWKAQICYSVPDAKYYLLTTYIRIIILVNQLIYIKYLYDKDEKYWCSRNNPLTQLLTDIEMYGETAIPEGEEVQITYELLNYAGNLHPK